MLKKAGLLRYILVLLFTVCNVVVPIAANAVRDSGHTSLHLSYVKPLFNSSTSGISFKRTPVKNDHIKVRYMGGDCGYDPSPFSVKLAQLFFNQNIALPDHIVFIFSWAHLLFKLRGPPGGCRNESILV